MLSRKFLPEILNFTNHVALFFPSVLETALEEDNQTAGFVNIKTNQKKDST